MRKTNIFNRLSFLSLFLVIVLLPVFFLPFTNIPVETSKGLILVVGLALCIIFWAIARFTDGKIILPKSLSLLGGAGVVLALFLSALFSFSPQVSFFGTMFDIGSFWFIFGGFLLMLMCSIVFRNPKYSKLLLLGAILSGAVVLIFQSVHLFIPNVLSLGVLASKTDNILGSWNALGIFAGLGALMSLLLVEFFSTTKMEKWLLQAMVVLSLLFVAVVNFPFVWVLLGIFSLIIFVYKVSTTSNKNKDEKQNSYFPAVSFIIIIVSLLFFISGSFIGGFLPNRLGISNNEISPSLGATTQVTKSVLKNNPVFGIGPNRFAVAFAMYKPVSINTTPFWDISFNSGSGLLPTLVSTTGFLGVLAWLVFFIFLIQSGVKSIFSSIKNGANWETMAFFVLSFYLFVSSFFYSTGAVLFLLALAFAGVFIGLSATSRAKGEISIPFLNDHRKSFFSILSLVLIIIMSAAASFIYLGRVASVSYFGKAITASTVPVAETSIAKALSLYANDLYLRTYAQIYLVKLSSIASKGDTLSDEDKATLQTSLNQAVSGGQLATTYDPKNYLNFQALGSLYQGLASLGVKDANTNAIEAYKTASTLNPLNPGLKLNMAIASNALGKTQEAKDFASAALALKPDYLDAFVVLSQIAKSEGDNVNAISYAETALSLSPQDKNLIQYVDSLKNPVSSNAEVPSDAPNPTDDTDSTKDSSTKNN